METAPEWKLDANRAYLNVGPLSATVDLFAPRRGLHHLIIADEPLVGCELLGVDLESAESGKAPALVDAYPRGGDLIAAYAQTLSSALSSQLYWRAALLEINGVICSTIDLQISVQTHLLESRPMVRTRSRLPACEAGPTAMVSPGQQHSGESSAHGFVFSPSGWQQSYVEMVHPADGKPSEIHKPSTTTIEVAHRLFQNDLEKGVILRARVRGLFAPRDGDVDFAWAAWRHFTDQPPPLTT